MLPKSGRQMPPGILFLILKGAKKGEVSGGNINRSCKTERVNLLEKCSHIAHVS